MWVFLSDAMLSIVEKPGDVKAGTLTVRARVAGDIEAVFPDAAVKQNGGTDYRYRAVLPRELVAKAMHDQVMGIDYSNFKGTVPEMDRHDAYMGCWTEMFRLQEARVRKR